MATKYTGKDTATATGIAMARANRSAGLTPAQTNAKLLAFWNQSPTEFIVAIASRNNPVNFMQAAKHVLYINGYAVNKYANQIDQFDKTLDAFIKADTTAGYNVIKQILAAFTFDMNATGAAAWTVSKTLWNALGVNVGNIMALFNKIKYTPSDAPNAIATS